MSSLELLTRAYGDVRFEVLKPAPFARPVMTLEEYIALRRSLYEEPSSSSSAANRREAPELEDTIEFAFELELGPEDELEPETRREGR